jgi:hypothetical protein
MRTTLMLLALLLAGTLVAASGDAQECEPTCEKECKAADSLCKASASVELKGARHACAAEHAEGMLECEAGMVEGRHECAGLCGPAVRACMAEVNAGFKECKADVKADARACKEEVGLLAVELREGCAEEKALCLEECAGGGGGDDGGEGGGLS